MELYKIYEGNIKTMCNTPCKIAIFTDGKNIKVFQKEFFRNTLIRPNWSRNIVLERHTKLNIIEEHLISAGFKIA